MSNRGCYFAHILIRSAPYLPTCTVLNIVQRCRF